MKIKEIEKHIFNISEIFYSIQGEGTRAGMPCLFIRLQGCRLRCVWCDTPYSLEFDTVEHQLSTLEIIDKIKSQSCKFIEFTGGEPLEQPEVIPLMGYLCDEGFTVAVETSGYLDVSALDTRIIKIMDIKCPDSKMSKKNKWTNIDYLTKNDEVKFVISSEKDYLWAKEITEKYDLIEKTNAVLFSTAFGKLSNMELAEMILRDSLQVRYQLQLHKYIWHPNRRGV